MAKVIDFQLFKLQRRGADHDPAWVLPWSLDQWPLCRIRYFARAVSAQPPRCCCGRTYNEATLLVRGPVIAAIVREAASLLNDGEEATIPRLIQKTLEHEGLTSVERAALSTGPCVSCPLLTAQTQQVRFVWGLYRAYWGRAVGSPGSRARSHHGQAVAEEARRSAVDLRGHIRQEISLIRRLQQRLMSCPWSRRHALRRTVGRATGC